MTRTLFFTGVSGFAALAGFVRQFCRIPSFVRSAFDDECAYTTAHALGVAIVFAAMFDRPFDNKTVEAAANRLMAQAGSSSLTYKS